MRRVSQIQYLVQRTFPVDPRTLNSSHSLSPSRLLSIIKNLVAEPYSWREWVATLAHLCDMTRATRSRMFFGHDFLKTAPRFSGEVVSLRGFFRGKEVWASTCGCDCDELEGPETTAHGSKLAPCFNSKSDNTFVGYKLALPHGRWLIVPRVR